MKAVTSRQTVEDAPNVVATRLRAKYQVLQK